jgi:predicted Zn-dependent peptidase
VTGTRSVGAAANRFPVERWRLANGLRVVVQADPGWPLIASVMCYAAGSRRDPISRSGLAHLCEHLAFYGPQAAGGTFPERVEMAGGSAQAVTTPDRMCFSQVFPRQALASALAVEAERMTWAMEQQDEEALEIQRRVLLEELHHRSKSRIRAAAFEHLHRCLYAEDHPYHRPPPGEPNGIRAVTLDDVERFVVSHFTPRNAVIVLIGDLSIKEVASLARRFFEAIPAGARDVDEDVPVSESPRALRAARVPAAVSGTHTHLGWSVAGFGDEQWYRAALLVRGLAVGRSSPLARELVDRSGLACDVRGSLVTMRDASTLVFGAVAAPGVEGQRLEEGLLDATDQLLSRGLTAGELARARRKALIDHYYAADSLERRADLCASLTCYLDAPERLEGEPDRYLIPDRDAVGAFSSWLRQETGRATLSLIPAAEAA